MNKIIKTTSLITIGVIISKVIKLNKTKYWKDDCQFKAYWLTLCGKRFFTMHLPKHSHCN